MLKFTLKITLMIYNIDMESRTRIQKEVPEVKNSSVLVSEPIGAFAKAKEVGAAREKREEEINEIIKSKKLDVPVKSLKGDRKIKSGVYLKESNLKKLKRIAKVNGYSINELLDYLIEQTNENGEK